ncbi:MAG: glucose-6-phosphate dehydrogenase assembly protein OpcA [Gloeomargarita sp. SKYBB_i_bin120]|nr:glucose-6-phosphate dehydrogenase assembly protein OpcA [Gloeomargarita sp. SKYG98]MCS7292084.1 glucose-6-phosphate dehydrogenase assembly protein OpcA [Gloeomargarita sp. SKYB120]MDW8177644.1 glucose-6-phosphate dehydrogenase assembly protein OpcA [Gloeomargarita sp. SKYBB_i_bin120]
MVTTEAVMALQTPKEVSIGQIESELSQIWLGVGGDEDAGPQAVRAATFTLVVYESPDVAAQTALSVEGLAVQNPCRVIHLRSQNDPEEVPLSAQVAAYCPLQKRYQSNLICCEYITLTGSRAVLERSLGLINALLIGDLPTYLWWQAQPDPDDPLLQGLLHLRETGGMRVLVDSATFPDAVQGLLALDRLVRLNVPLADLNWSRLSSWQELTAEAFDPPDRRADLPKIDQVRIDYEKGNPAQALLFLGWLASRLHWVPQSSAIERGDADVYRFVCHAPTGQEIKAELVGLPVADSGTVIGDLLGLRLDSTQPEAKCCTVLCSETSGCMRLEGGGKAEFCRVEQVTTLRDIPAETLLGQQIQRWGQQSLLFQESLAVTVALLQTLPS